MQGLIILVESTLSKMPTTHLFLRVHKPLRSAFILNFMHFMQVIELKTLPAIGKTTIKHIAPISHNLACPSTLFI